MFRFGIVALVGSAACGDAPAAIDAAPPECTADRHCAEEDECVGGTCLPRCRDTGPGCNGGVSDFDYECCAVDEVCCPVYLENSECMPAAEGCPPAGPWPCNPYSHSGCAAGEKCAHVLDDPETGSGHLACVPDGTLEIGEPCTDPAEAGDVDACVAGAFCYGGACLEICDTFTDECTDGACITVQVGSGPAPPFSFCLPYCDPLAQDCPAADEGCYIAGEPVCVSAGTAAVGEPCTTANGCEPGLMCGPAEGGGFVCRRLCGPWMDCGVADCGCGATAACASDEICVPISDGMGGVAHDTAGYCVADVDACGP